MAGEVAKFEAGLGLYAIAHQRPGLQSQAEVRQEKLNGYRIRYWDVLAQGDGHASLPEVQSAASHAVGSACAQRRNSHRNGQGTAWGTTVRKRSQRCSASSAHLIFYSWPVTLRFCQARLIHLRMGALLKIRCQAMEIRREYSTYYSARRRLLRPFRARLFKEGISLDNTAQANGND
jgi:hypothetical protein